MDNNIITYHPQLLNFPVINMNPQLFIHELPMSMPQWTPKKAMYKYHFLEDYEKAADRPTKIHPNAQTSKS